VIGMRDARDRFQAMIDDLRRNPNVRVATADMADPASSAEIEAATELAGGYLPAGVAEFYSQLNGIQLEWRHTVAKVRHGDESDKGLIDILPITEVFGDWEGVTWFGDDDDEYRSVKPFDMFVPEACTAFIQPPGKRPADTVAYHYFGEELHVTGYKFDEYLERLLASRGFWYWIQALCPDLQDSSEVADFRRAMPLIFDDYDDSLFQPR
jgi:hypothetical protein